MFAYVNRAAIVDNLIGSTQVFNNRYILVYAFNPFCNRIFNRFAPCNAVLGGGFSRNIGAYKFKRRVFQFPIKEPPQIDIQAAFPQRQQALQAGLIFLFVRLIVPVGVRLIHVGFRVIHVFDKGDILSAYGFAFIILDGVDTQSGADKFSGVRAL